MVEQKFIFLLKIKCHVEKNLLEILWYQNILQKIIHINNKCHIMKVVNVVKILHY